MRVTGMSSASASSRAPASARVSCPAIARRSVSARARSISSGVSAMSVHITTMLVVELTDPQRRTYEGLIGVQPRPSFPSDLAQRLRDRIEEAVRGLELAEPLWLGKEKLNEFARCQGKFLALLMGERAPFEHNTKSAAGVLQHAAIE